MTLERCAGAGRGRCGPRCAGERWPLTAGPSPGPCRAGFSAGAAPGAVREGRGADFVRTFACAVAGLVGPLAACTTMEAPLSGAAARAPAVVAGRRAAWPEPPSAGGAGGAASGCLRCPGLNLNVLCFAWGDVAPLFTMAWGMAPAWDVLRGRSSSEGMVVVMAI